MSFQGRLLCKAFNTERTAEGPLARVPAYMHLQVLFRRECVPTGHTLPTSIISPTTNLPVSEEEGIEGVKPCERLNLLLNVMGVGSGSGSGCNLKL